MPPTSGQTAALVDTSMSKSTKTEPAGLTGAVRARASDTELVDTSAPVTAWSTREIARISNVTADAARVEARAKATTAMRNVRRCQNGSQRLPLVGSAIDDGTEIDSDERGDGRRADGELGHDARQGDREHGRIERDEDRAGREAEHRPVDQRRGGPASAAGGGLAVGATPARSVGSPDGSGEPALTADARSP